MNKQSKRAKSSGPAESGAHHGLPATCPAASDLSPLLLLLLIRLVPATPISPRDKNFSQENKLKPERGSARVLRRCRHSRRSWRRRRSSPCWWRPPRRRPTRPPSRGTGAATSAASPTPSTSPPTPSPTSAHSPPPAPATDQVPFFPSFPALN